MSRSRKKTPICKDGNRKKSYDKALANRRFRRARIDDETFNDAFAGKSNRYKHFNESWEIADYTSRWTLSDAVRAWYEEEKPSYYDWYFQHYGVGYYHHTYGTIERYLNHCWRKYYRGK